MKRLILFVAIAFNSSYAHVNFDWDSWHKSRDNINQKPRFDNSGMVHYHPDRIDLKQTVIQANPGDPLPITFARSGNPLPITFDKDVAVTLNNKDVTIKLNNKEVPVTINQDNPIPIRIELPENAASEAFKNINEILKEQVAPQLKETWQTLVGTFLNTSNALRFAYPIALFGIVALSGFYGSRVFWKVLEKNLLSPKPQIVQPGSKYGWLDRWKRSRNGYKTPSSIFGDIINERLEEIKEKTKNIRNNIRKGKNITYDNLLLFGKPGTGKTLFAQILADYTDMDFLCVTAASLLQSGIEGIKYFDELFDMANRSKYGLILFIDEADALFVNRNMLKPDSDHYKVLNHILAATGSGSNKLMMIAATNHAHVIDPAMGRRFQERIEMPLPDEQTRKKLLLLYIKEYLSEYIDTISLEETSLRFGQTPLITAQRIADIAQMTQGLSHAEIKDMVLIMGKKAAATSNNTLTEKHIRSAVSEIIEKKEAFKKDKAKLKKKNVH